MFGHLRGKIIGFSRHFPPKKPLQRQIRTFQTGSKGQARLLSLCVRLLTLIEIVTRRHLKAHGQTLPGLYLDNANRRTAKPTAKRLLRAFHGIHRVRLPNQVASYTTPLTDLQQQILSILCITTSIYQARAPDSHHSSPSNERADKF